MHVLREIFRQKLVLARSHRQVAAALGVSMGKISGALARATALGLDAARIEALSDAELEAALYPKTVAASERAVPDCAELHLELRRPKVTLALLHVEFIEKHPDGILYSAFCNRYRDWAKRASPVMRQVHAAGDKLFVDYAGMKARIVDPNTGEVTDVELFVAVLGASNYTYAEATRTQQVADFVSSIARAMTFLGGVPNAVVPDQLKSAVTGSCRYEPAIQRTTAELGRYYGTTILPARPRSPRDKAKVEGGVLIAERWLLARIRNEIFTSLGALNVRLAELTADLNARTMKTYKASRRDLFERLDKPALRPLPAEPFEVSTWKEVKLNVDYHFELEHHLYSASYLLIQDELWTRLTASAVEVFRGGERVAVHARSYVRGGRTTVLDHMPSTHRAHAEWTPSRILGWAGQEVGPNAHALCEVILRERRHPEWGFRSCLGLLRLAKKYGNERVEKASRRALLAGARSYRHVKTILQHNLDGAPPPEPDSPASSGPTHENIRGSDYYHLPNSHTRQQTLERDARMLREPTIEKLHALHMRNMAAAWLEQDKSPDTIALPFDDRLAMIVDAEALARDNARLTKNLRDAKLRVADACVEGIDFPRERQLDKSQVRQLATCRWVSEHQTVIVTGATGTGKSYFACAIAHQACRKGFRVMYRRVPRLFDELRLARADGTYQRLLARIAKVDVLVLDDFAISPLADDSRRDLLEILEDRYGLRATVITSQLKHDRWHDYLADPNVADAICDRVLHGANKVALAGPSRRKQEKEAATG